MIDFKDFIVPYRKTYIEFIFLIIFLNSSKFRHNNFSSLHIFLQKVFLLRVSVTTNIFSNFIFLISISAIFCSFN